MHIRTQEDGITLLITLLLMGVLLGVSASLLNITIKQFQLSGIAAASEMAFQASNAGIECALYHDFKTTGSPFDVPDDGSEQSSRPSIDCMGLTGVLADDTEDDDTDGKMKSGEEQRFQFSWGEVPYEICTDVSVYKFSSASGVVDVSVDGVDMRPSADCPAGSVCTVIQSRGYNTSCSDITGGGRVVEREYTQVY